MASSAKAGLLGFASGYAGSKSDQIDMEYKLEQEEALRMRVQEASILKERRLLQYKSEAKVTATAAAKKLADDERDLQLFNTGVIDADGNLMGDYPIGIDKTNVAKFLDDEAANDRIVGRADTAAERAQSRADKAPVVVPENATVTTAGAYQDALAGKSSVDDIGVKTGEGRLTRKEIDASLSKVRVALDKAFPVEFNAAAQQRLAGTSWKELSSGNARYGQPLTAAISTLVRNDWETSVADMPTDQLRVLSSAEELAAIQGDVRQLESDIKGTLEKVNADSIAAHEVDPTLLDDPERRKEMARAVLTKPIPYTTKDGKPGQYTIQGWLQDEGLDAPYIEALFYNTFMKPYKAERPK